MRISETDIADVRVITPDVFEDYRGEYIETYNEETYKEAGIFVDFVQDDISYSRKDTLRGLHGDGETWKLVSCVLGDIYLVVLDLRPESPSRGRWCSFMITDRNHRQVLVPPGCANGHLALSDRVGFHYKQSTYYKPGTQFTVRWDDPDHAIHWPITRPLLSRRDASGGTRSP
ncbi:MAG: dTDP-4-dehydrorhamnose 3,5-epimerase [Rhodospirillum sp.]|nr:dTDP-4-dehydrorhamnose 3,5-epimerase [Rhodospirillum sp.]MCF8487627.1 dTDP-4-dehydrorhamnose 3,5-epimerase [Rhodospirillum sp.]MCF8499231.1 dTDP-4-dehydrorhamnose 3,5-epimerase [Rhodospirillum sp.]